MIPDDFEESIVAKVGRLKRNCFAAVFERYFAFQEAEEEGQVTIIHQFMGGAPGGDIKIYILFLLLFKSILSCQNISIFFFNFFFVRK